MTTNLRAAVGFALALSATSALAANVTGDAERGRRIHLGEETIPGVAACNTCHGVDGDKTQAPTFPRLAGQYPEYLVHALEGYKSGTRKNAVMQPMASALSRKDMEDLSVYFGSLQGTLDDLADKVD
jgi:cytochrome c553